MFVYVCAHACSCAACVYVCDMCVCVCVCVFVLVCVCVCVFVCVCVCVCDVSNVFVNFRGLRRSGMVQFLSLARQVVRQSIHVSVMVSNVAKTSLIGHVIDRDGPWNVLWRGRY